MTDDAKILLRSIASCRLNVPSLPVGFARSSVTSTLDDAADLARALLAAQPSQAQAGEAVENSPAYCLRGLYKPAMEYFLEGKPCTQDEYIEWQAGIIAAVTKAKLPDPKYYGGSAEEGDQHEVKCAYVDGWNDCRASILEKSPASPNDGWWINELTNFWGDGLYVPTMDTRRAAKIALDMIAASPVESHNEREELTDERIHEIAQQVSRSMAGEYLFTRDIQVRFARALLAARTGEQP